MTARTAARTVESMYPAVAKYLQTSPRARVPTRVNPSPDAPAALVIVETRPLPYLASVIATAVASHPSWPLYVVGPERVHASLSEKVYNYVQVVLDVDTMTIAEYNMLLTSPEFWGTFKEPSVLIFQSDCVLVRPTPPSFLALDYVGAVCGTLDPQSFVMNGGLSLRRVDAMKRCVEHMHRDGDDLTAAEDVTFCSVMRRHAREFVCPTMEVCDAYAIESQGDPTTAVGMHGTDKAYAPPQLVDALLDSAEK